MRKHLSVWLAVMLFVLATAKPAVSENASEVRLPPGVQAVWDLDQAWHETTPTRERICINGLWRWQAADEVGETVPADSWGYYKVPAPWSANSQTLYPHPAWKGQHRNATDVAWYQRAITIPGAWQGRRIAVSAEYLNSYAAVFLDGRKVGDLYFPSGEVEITSACRPGQSQVLSLCVKAVPLAAVMQAFTDTSAPKTIKGSVELRGLCGDVFLVSTPPAARIEDVKVRTSVRKWTITWDVAVQGLEPGKSYRLRAQVKDESRNVKDVTSDPFTAADLQDGRFSLAAEWQPDKLWDTHTPQNMYGLETCLIDRDGQVLDAFRPLRFGFREFWIDGRDYYLNGTPVSRVPHSV